MKVRGALLNLLLIVAMLWAATTAGATVINFDDLGPVIGDPNMTYANGQFADPGIGAVPVQYAGFTWSMFWGVHKDYYSIAWGWPGTGYENGVVSGSYAAFNNWAAVASVDGRPFVFRSAYLTAAVYDTLQVTVTGYREGAMVYAVTVDTQMASPTMFAFPAAKVDTVSFTPGIGDGVFVMDDFTYATIPVVDASVNIQVASDSQSTLVIHGTAADGDGESLVYRWLEGQNVLSDWKDVGPNGQADLNLALLPAFPAGDHTLTLQVKPRNIPNFTPESDDMILTVSNSAPHATPTGAGSYEAGAPVTLGGEVSDYDGDTLTYKWIEGSTVLFQNTVAAVYGGASVPLPGYVTNALSVGTHTLTLRVSDGTNAPVSKDITVKIIDDQAPKLAPKADKSILWPPFHQMIPVTIVANAIDNSGGPVTLTATVTSNEPNSRKECHEPDKDWTTPVIDQTTGVITLKLRAERNPRGAGREYTITITATDQSGNSSKAVVHITVARFFVGDCDYWWNHWHNNNRNRWNDAGYKDWFDNWYSDWFRGWYR